MIRAIKQNMIDTALNSESSITLDELYHMSREDRFMFIDRLNKHLKAKADSYKM